MSTLYQSTSSCSDFCRVEIEDFHRPRPMTGAEHAAFLDRFWRLTDALAARGEE